MADQIRTWSDELARDPNSLVFLELGDALRRQRQFDVAHKIALRGAERHPRNADAHDLVARIAADRGDLRTARERWSIALALAPGHAGALKGMQYVSYHEGRSGGGERHPAPIGPPAASPAAAGPVDPTRLFADLLLDEGQTAILLDAGGYVLGGVYLDANGVDAASDVGAQLTGITDEVRRATRHLDIGDWTSITFETQVAVVAMAPSVDASLVVVAASRATPLGLVRRLLERCTARSTTWLERGVGT